MDIPYLNTDEPMDWTTTEEPMDWTTMEEPMDWTATEEPMNWTFKKKDKTNAIEIGHKAIIYGFGHRNHNDATSLNTSEKHIRFSSNP